MGDFYRNPRDTNRKNDGTVAAKICAEYSVEYQGVTYDDWFLPSIDELRRMYDTIYSQSGLLPDVYWSSSEYDANAARVINFNFPMIPRDDKYSVYRVRPIRAF